MSTLRRHGPALIEEIEQTPCWNPTLWWLGHSGFALKYHSMILYLDPCFSPLPGRILEAPLQGGQIRHADLVLASHAHARHMDGGALVPLLEASPRAKLVLPKSAAHHANSLGIPFTRMTTTDAALRVEYFHSGDYIRVYAVPSAHPELEHTPLGGYPYLGYLIRCGGCTIYHAGDCVPYPMLAASLKPYSVNVALLPIDGGNGSHNFTVDQAAGLAEEIGAQWVVPMHYGSFANSGAEADRFVEHMLFQRPAQRFKVFECGEGWSVPEE